MKMTTPTKPLLDDLGVAFHFADSNEESPLACVKVVSRGDRTQLMARSGNTSIVINPDYAESQSDGEILLSRRVAKSIALSDDETTVFEDREGVVRINQHAKLAMPRAVAFPSVPLHKASRYHDVSRSDLLRAIDRTVYAADDTSGRFALSCVSVEAVADTVTFVAMDGRRISSQAVGGRAVGDHVIDAGACLVPKVAIGRLASVLRKSESERVRLSSDSTHMVVSDDRLTVCTRLTEGGYPPWRDVMPKQTRETFASEAGPLCDSIRQCAITAGRDSYVIEMRIRPGEMILSSGLSEVGNSEIPCPVKYYTSETRTRVDYRYLSDVAGAFVPNASLSIGVNSNNGMITIVSGDGFSGLIVPVGRPHG